MTTVPNEAGRKTARVLLLVERDDSAAQLSEWVRTQDAYESVERTGRSIADASFDICVFDQPGFERYERQLLRSKAQTDSVVRPYLLVVPPMTDPQGRSLGWEDIEQEFLGVVDDIVRLPVTDLDVRATFDRNRRHHREAEKHRETSVRLEQFERTVAAMEHAVYVTDTEGTIEFVNPAFTEMTGYGKAEALGKTPALLRSDYHDEEYYRRLWETISAGDIWDEDVVNERKNGERYHAEQTIVPVIDADGDSQRYVAVQTDVTERINKTKQLEVLDRILRHNLRNDLNVIQARAEMLEEAITADHLVHLEAILSKSRELVETADKEREIARLLLSDQPRTEQNVSQSVRRAVVRVQQEYPHVQFDASVPDDIRWPASPKLSRAIEELLVNGVVHNDTTQPAVSVSVTEHSEAVEIAVSDNGPGIPDAETAVLTRADSLDQLFHGSGLGLWLVYWVVRFSQGELSFTENSPRGSVVTVRLMEANGGRDQLQYED